ncbi:MAG: 16S rRNA (guanine(966)-N(2))-methyltransferase RsmD [Calditrichaeota bacterium]|nr:16S rRNA (guanine(966)-N(2))-methyltransferase RsmD [Calditrichota bacterium]
MRIISGVYKGRKLKSSDDFSIRPTTDRVKALIFNVLQDFPEGKTVVDIFSGSGSLGLEALSRGAKKVYFVDKSSKSLAVLKQNIELIGIPEENYTIIKQDALQFARTADFQADLLLLDPPFKYPELQELIDSLLTSQMMSEKSVLVAEHERINPIQQESKVYEILIQKKMGRSLISFIVKKENE